MLSKPEVLVLFRGQCEAAKLNTGKFAMDEVGSSDDEDYVPSEEGNGSEHDEISEQEDDVDGHAQPSSSAEQSK